jgi:hypothetical protein
MDSFQLLKARVASLEVLNSQASAPGGVTPGGFVQDHDKTEWYMKRHNEPEHSHIEHLANIVYRSLGHQAPHSMILHDPSHNRPVYLSKKIHGLKTLEEVNGWGGAEHPRAAQHFLSGLAADTLLNNFDLHSRNVGFVGKSPPIRVDNGSALMYGGTGRYHGNPSHAGFADMFGFFSSHLGAYRHAMAAHRVVESRDHVIRASVHPGILGPQVRRITALRDRHGSWSDFIERHIPHAAQETKRKASEILDHRTAYLEAHVRQHRTGQESPFRVHQDSQNPAGN